MLVRVLRIALGIACLGVFGYMLKNDYGLIYLVPALGAMIALNGQGPDWESD